MLFGGHRNTIKQDAIYILDLNGGNKWQKLDHITCPVPACYTATLTPDNHVHLFLGSNDNNHKGHYELPISSIMGSKFTIDNEEEKKSSELDELQAKNESLQKLINDLMNDKEIEQNKSKQELAKLIKENDEYFSKYQQAQNQNNEYKQENEALKSQLIQAQIARDDYMQKNKEKEAQILALSQQLREAKEREMTLSEEYKEAQMELIKVKKELKEIKKKHIDPNRFMEWTADEFVDWICNLDEGKYAEYEDKLREAFKSEGIDGSAIPDIEKNDWKGWGIQMFKDRTNIHKHTQALKQQNVNSNDNNEVAPAYDSNYNEGGNKTEYH